MQLSAGSLSVLALLATPSVPCAAARLPREHGAALTRRLARTERTAAGRALSPATAPGSASGNLAPTPDAPDCVSNAATNTNGVTLVRGDDDCLTYEYGQEIVVDFHVVAAEMDQDVLATLDATATDKWTVGLYMRMARPGVGVDPIEQVTPAMAGRRRLQLQRDGGKGGAGADTGADTGGDSSPYSDGDDDGDILGALAISAAAIDSLLPLQGTATFTADQTTLAKLADTKYGTGFDAYLLDENNLPIVGPAEFHMVRGEDDDGVAGAGTLSVSSGNGNDKGKGKGKGGDSKSAAYKHPLVQLEELKKESRKKTPTAAVAKGMSALGGGAGGHGNGMILSTPERRGTYYLETDSLVYEAGATITVTYNVGLDAGNTARRMQKGKDRGMGADAAATTAGGRNEGPGSDGQGDPTPSLENVFDDADDGADDGAGDGADDGADAAPNMAAYREDEMDQATGAFLDDGANMAAYGEDEMDQATGAFLGAAADTVPDPTVDDAESRAGYVIAVLMREGMALGNEANLVKYQYVGEVDAGTVEFQADELDWQKYGTGYSVWVLDGAYGELAGPVRFALAVDE